jgi:hypothetical protein
VLTYNCQLTNPNGSVVFQRNGGWQSFQSYVETHNQPINVFGTWQASSQYWISFYEDEYFADNSLYDDPDGYGYLGVQTCNSSCNLYGNGEWNEIYNQTYQIGQSSISVYIDPVTVQVLPSTISLDAGESQTFTAEVAGVPSGGSTGVTWTISNLSGGTESSGASTYAYTAPSVITTSQELTLKACSTIAPTVCETVTIALLAENIAIESPSPSVLFADGQSTSTVYADFTNAATNSSVTWTATPGTITSTGDATATFLAPASSINIFQSGPSAPVAIKGCIGNTTICNTNNSLILVQPVGIASTVPASLTAGTTTAVTITGGGFGSIPTVTVNSPTWQGVAFTQTSATNTQISGSLVVPANLSNMTASQPITLTVSATTDGLSSSATSNAINVAPVVYTYAINLSSTASQLTYGGTANLVPIITCRTNSGACGSGVSNPQLANFSVINGMGSLSKITNASATTFTAIAMNSTPQVVTVQGCASVSTSVCATTTLSVAATTLTLNPPAMSSVLTGGKTQIFSASIQNPGTANQLAWNLTATPSAAAMGTLVSASSAIAGTPTSGTSSNTYTAPIPITTPTTVTLNVCMAANANICATPVSITLQPPPTFTVTASNNNPLQTALSLGHSMSYSVNVSALNGFTGPVTLSVSGLPAGVIGQLSTSTINTSGSATLTLTSAYSTTTFIGQSAVTVTGTSGGLTNPASISLTTRPLQYRGDCGVQ